MTIDLLAFRTKIFARIAHSGGPQLISTRIAQPVRDWKIVLLTFSIAVLCFGLFAFLPYAGLLESATTVAVAPQRTVKIDAEALSKTAAALTERRTLHERARKSGNAFVDPGR